MDKPALLKAFESLSSEVRLDIFRLLVEAGSAGLVTVQPEGRFQRYRANIAQVLRMVSCLADCCLTHEAGREAPANRSSKPVVTDTRSVP